MNIAVNTRSIITEFDTMSTHGGGQQLPPGGAQGGGPCPGGGPTCIIGMLIFMIMI